MTIASAKSCAAWSALLPLCFACSEAGASDRVETGVSVTIVPSAAVTVVNSAPLQTLLLTAAIAPAGLVFTASSAADAASGGGAGIGGAGGNAPGGGEADSGGAGRAATDGASPAGLIAFGGSLTGTTIAGDAVSVSVGNMSDGSAAGSARVCVVIAQYN